MTQHDDKGPGQLQCNIPQEPDGAARRQAHMHKNGMQFSMTSNKCLPPSCNATHDRHSASALEAKMKSQVNFDVLSTPHTPGA